MDELRVTTFRFFSDFFPEGRRTAALHVNGADLFDVFASIEDPSWKPAFKGQMWDDMITFPPDDSAGPQSHLLQEAGPESAEAGSGRTILMVCGADEIDGCGNISVAVKFGEAEVEWSDFRTSGEEFYDAATISRWRALGPFVFGRKQYEHALRNPEAEEPPIRLGSMKAIHCPSCDGNGRCSACAGSGLLKADATKNCPSCSAGVCRFCQGRGRTGSFGTLDVPLMAVSTPEREASEKRRLRPRLRARE